MKRHTLTTGDLRRIRELRYEDGLTCDEVARRIGCSSVTVQKYAPGRPGKVPVAPIREAFLASDKTAADVARHLGWQAGRSRADSGRVKRALGLLDDISGSGLRSRRQMIDAEQAGLIAEALGMALWEVAA